MALLIDTKGAWSRRRHHCRRFVRQDECTSGPSSATPRTTAATTSSRPASGSTNIRTLAARGVEVEGVATDDRYVSSSARAGDHAGSTIPRSAADAGLRPWRRMGDRRRQEPRPYRPLARRGDRRPRHPDRIQPRARASLSRRDERGHCGRSRSVLAQRRGAGAGRGRFRRRQPRGHAPFCACRRMSGAQLAGFRLDLRRLRAGDEPLVPSALRRRAVRAFGSRRCDGSGTSMRRSLPPEERAEEAEPADRRSLRLSRRRSASARNATCCSTTRWPSMAN